MKAWKVKHRFKPGEKVQMTEAGRFWERPQPGHKHAYYEDELMLEILRETMEDGND